MGDIGSDKVQEIVLDTIGNTIHKIKVFFKKKKKKKSDEENDDKKEE